MHRAGKLAARAPYDGTVYIWDTTSDKMIYEGKVRDGQYVSIDRNRREHIGPRGDGDGFR